MTEQEFKEIWQEHKRNIEEDERNKQRREEWDRKLAKCQCNDNYAERVKNK